jgi:hypothetical protein
MPQVLKPSRLQLDLREETWPVPGRTVSPWTTAAMRSARARSVALRPALPECTCQTDCIRDHENE